MEWFGVITTVFAMLATFATAYATIKIVSTMKAIYDREREDDIRKQKILTFWQIIGNRYAMVRETVSKEHLLSEQRYYEALNTCAVVFTDEENVIKALKEYHDEPNPHALYTLCESIANNFKYKS